MNRREFVGSAAAGAALLARGASVLAAGPRYDLLIKGGRVIDPSVRLDAQRDVAIVDGRIAAIEPSIAAEGAPRRSTRAASSSCRGSSTSIRMPRAQSRPTDVLADGVTGWIDASSAGADNLEPAIAVAMGSVQPGRVLAEHRPYRHHPGRDTKDLALADVGAARAAIERHRDYRGWCQGTVVGERRGMNDYEVLRRTAEVAAPRASP
jgi:dihydroorotase